MGGQIGLAEKSAFFDVPFLQVVSDIAAVETIRDGLKPLFAIAFGLLLGLHQLPVRHGQIRIPVLAGLNSPPVRSIDVPGWTACIQNRQSRFNDLPKTLRPMQLQKRYDGIERRRHGSRPNHSAAWNAALLEVPLDCLRVKRRASLTG